MENASKALIIAGAILLAILIIALGVMVYNNAKETVGSSNLSETEISAFNSKWEAYQGTNKTAAEVQTMISAMISNNSSEDTNGTERYVGVVDDSSSSVTIRASSYSVDASGCSLNSSYTAPANVPNYPSNIRYEITCDYNSNGLVAGMYIETQS